MVHQGVPIRTLACGVDRLVLLEPLHHLWLHWLSVLAPLRSRGSRLIALRLYMGTPFGQLDSRNQKVIALANRIGRTAGAVAVKACNFASLDPECLKTNAKRFIWDLPSTMLS